MDHPVGTRLPIPPELCEKFLEVKIQDDAIKEILDKLVARQQITIKELRAIWAEVQSLYPELSLKDEHWIYTGKDYMEKQK